MSAPEIHRIAESNYGDAVTVELHRHHAVLREDKQVIGVIGTEGGELKMYDSLEQWEADQ
jgi:hypothetical protein